MSRGDLSVNGFFREEISSVDPSVYVGKGCDSVVSPSGLRGVRVIFGF